MAIPLPTNTPVPTVTPLSTDTPVPAQAIVIISRIYYDGHVPRVESDEYAEILSICARECTTCLETAQ